MVLIFMISMSIAIGIHQMGVRDAYYWHTTMSLREQVNLQKSSIDGEEC